MYERKELFFKRIRDYACECHKVVNDAINELELFLEYRDAKSEALRSSEVLPPKDEIILRLSDENTGTVASVNLLEPLPSHTEVIPKNASQIAPLPSSMEDDEIMKYLSKRSDGRWQYRRTVNGKRIYIYGRTQAICLLKVKEAQKKNFRTGERKLMSFHSFARWWLDTFKKRRTQSEHLQGLFLHRQQAPENRRRGKLHYGGASSESAQRTASDANSRKDIADSPRNLQKSISARLYEKRHLAISLRGQNQAATD